ncbi:hypothetical protein F2Q69_00046081 [Brassica cretica]|uniref:Uncharacterized protein n=1 Tax=Brassica cretica TaxID=69181 RepID=A0A8S9PX93_BRACR|nr:hypothetical protein F2Q69_00046081 [Brassica cretica]
MSSGLVELAEGVFVIPLIASPCVAHGPTLIRVDRIVMRPLEIFPLVMDVLAETPKDNGGGDSSADEEHPANRRRIEVILSQQYLSYDDDIDDTPVLGDLRDILKRKFESENDSSPKHTDQQTILDTRKSRRISTSDANNNKGPITDLRDKLNAGACDLRIQLNRLKPTDLRR